MPVQFTFTTKIEMLKNVLSKYYSSPDKRSDFLTTFVYPIQLSRPETPGSLGVILPYWAQMATIRSGLWSKNQ